MKKSFKFANLFFKPLEKFIKIESASGIILMLCALLSMYFANSSFQNQYFDILNLKIFSLSLLHWINDGLMALFFFVVGLEIKREIVAGELSSLRKATLPIAAALGGMFAPALIYFYFNQNDGNPNGWAIPMATDIAFALGILSLFGQRVHINLKIFLLALAIVDDLGAVLVIAFFYTDKIQFWGLIISAVAIMIVLLNQKRKVRNYFIYTVCGIVVWGGFLYSGIHATIAGVLMGLLTPYSFSSQDSLSVTFSPIEELIHFLHPFVGFLIMPVFALANAGVNLSGVQLGTLLENPISLGVVAGLLFGKPLGIVLFSLIVLVFKLADLPQNVNMKQFLSISLLAGIGFTMSIFIASLSLEGADLSIAKVSILSGSILSAIIGSVFLSLTLKKIN